MTLPGTREAKALLLLFCTAVALLIPLFSFKFVPLLALFAVYATPFLLVISLPFVMRLQRSGNLSVPVYPALLGVILIVVGGLFDVTATLVHTPDLKREANLLARALLDSGHPLTVVLLFGFLCQILLLLVLCELWLALLRHRLILAESLRGFQSPLLFMKAATGGADLTWRQWMLPLRFSELPRAYHTFWAGTATLLVAGTVDRWYLGLEWFKLVPRIRWYVATLAATSGLLCYLTWLWYALGERQSGVVNASPQRVGSEGMPGSTTQLNTVTDRPGS